jgi:hypothetical protein
MRKLMGLTAASAATASTAAVLQNESDGVTRAEKEF